MIEVGIGILAALVVTCSWGHGFYTGRISASRELEYEARRNAEVVRRAGAAIQSWDEARAAVRALNRV